jgi:bacterioferritin
MNGLPLFPMGSEPSPPMKKGWWTMEQQPEEPALSDVESIRARAREHVDSGAVTSSYRGDPQKVIELLNQALATELVCTLRYRRHYFMASGLASEGVKDEFLEHAAQELEHADRIAERIVQLGGKPDFNPQTLTARSHSEYIEADSLREMIREDLIAERIAIESYTEIIAYLENRDPTTHKLMREILAVEEEHAEDMASLLGGMSEEH